MTLGRSSRRVMIGFYLFPATTPLGIYPLLPVKGGTIPSWVNEPKNPKDKEMEGKEEWKAVSMRGNGMMTLQRST
jgi:hypothetical protein